MQKILQKFKLYFNFVIEIHNFSSYTHLKYDGCRIFAKQCFLSCFLEVARRVPAR